MFHLITWKLEYSGFVDSNKLFWLSTIQFYYKVHHLIPRTTIGPLVSLQSCLLWKTYFLFCLQFSWDTSKINLEMTMMGGQGVRTVLASHSQKVPNCVWLMCVQRFLQSLCMLLDHELEFFDISACCMYLSKIFSIFSAWVSNFKIWLLNFKIKKEHVSETRKIWGKNVVQDLMSKKIRCLKKWTDTKLHLKKIK